MSSFTNNFQVYNEQTISFPPNRESILLACPFRNTVWQQPSNSTSSVLPDGRILVEQLTSSAEGVYTCSSMSEPENAISIILLQGL